MSHVLHEALSPASTRGNAARGVLLSLSLAMLLSSLGTSIANVALPTLARAFDASFQSVQWIVLAYLLSVTTLTVVAGRLGDVAGRRRMLLAGIVFFSVASAVAGLAPTLPLLIAARAAQGIGAAVMMALSLALATDVAPKARTGAAMGVLGTMSAIGTALGPSLGGALIAVSGWRALFLVQAAVGAITFLIATTSLPDEDGSRQRNARGFDLAGTLLLALTLGAYTLAVTLGRGSFGPINGALLIAAFAGALLFTRVERRVDPPLIRISMLRNSVLTSSLALSTIVSTIVMAILVVGPFYLSRALQLDATMVGLVLSAGPLVAAITGVPAGRLVDRFQPERISLAGLLGIAAGCAALAILPPSGVAAFVLPVTIITASYALFQTANNTGVMRDAGAERGVVSGMLTLSRNIGLLTGASMMGAVFAFAAGMRDATLTAPDAVAFGLRATFVVALVLIAVAIGIVTGMKRRHE
jgi:MFS family permease